MWIWNGKITPEPGENIHDACREACALARHYGGHTQKPVNQVDSHVFFEFTFNDTVLRAYPHTHYTELVEQFNETRRPKERK